jgi:hypothetical protein
MAALGGQPPCPVPGATAPSRHGLEAPSRSGARQLPSPCVGAVAGRSVRALGRAGVERRSRSARPSRRREGTGCRCSASWPANWTTAASTTATSLHSPRHCGPSSLPTVDARGCETGDPDPPACGKGRPGARSPRPDLGSNSGLRSSCRAGGGCRTARSVTPATRGRQSTSPGAEEPEVSSSSCPAGPRHGASHQETDRRTGSSLVA